MGELAFCGITIGGIDCDRICGVGLCLRADDRMLSVIGVYLPCLNLIRYSECLIGLERVVSESSLRWDLFCSFG